MSRTWQITSAAVTSSSVARNAATSCVGEVRDEAHSIRQNRLLDTRQCDCTHGRIKRGEQQVLRHYAGAGQSIEQGRFSGIGIADERDHRPRCAFPPLAMQAARLANLLEFLAQAAPSAGGSSGGRPRSESRPTTEEAEAAALAFEVGPICVRAGSAGNPGAPVRPASGPRQLLPCSPKISRINPVRSITLRASLSSRLRCWIGVNAPSTTTSSASFCSQAIRMLSTCPAPNSRFGRTSRTGARKLSAMTTPIANASPSASDRRDCASRS